MISEAQAAEAPRIVIPTRPLEVPPELLALQPDAVVCYSQAKNPGVYLQSTFGTAAEAIQLVRDTIARQAAGRFYIFEAAQVLADANGFPARVVLRNMHRAVEDGRLRFRDVTGQPVRPSDPRGEYMTPDDLNSWLEWAGVGYRFPTPQAAAEPDAPAASLAEPVRFADLPRVMAEAMHADPMARAGARINLEAELAEMVASGRLKVRDSLTRGPHPHPVGAALKDAVLLPQEVRRLLAERGVSLPDVAAPAPTHAPSASASPAARPEAVAAPAAPEAPDIASAPAVVHRVGNRAHPLDGVIAEARRRAVGDDWLTVWGELTRMAERPDRPAPLMGYAPGDGLKVQSDAPEGFTVYTKDAFRQLWRRRNKG